MINHASAFLWLPRGAPQADSLSIFCPSDRQTRKRQNQDLQPFNRSSAWEPRIRGDKSFMCFILDENPTDATTLRSGLASKMG